MENDMKIILADGDHPRHAGNILRVEKKDLQRQDHPRHAGNMPDGIYGFSVPEDHPRHAGNMASKTFETLSL